MKEIETRKQTSKNTSQVVNTYLLSDDRVRLDGIFPLSRKLGFFNAKIAKLILGLKIEKDDTAILLG